MIQTTLIGYPRIGQNRELKKATEAYFQGRLSPEELQAEGASLRKTHWEDQKDAGIHQLVSNDFSFYDTLLDTALLFGLVPERFNTLPQDPLIRTFAMARGYQQGGLTAKALSMKKWFTTNYHYMVPEIDSSSPMDLMGHKPITEFREARKQGFHTRPMLPGPYTLLRLSRFADGITAEKAAQKLIPAYQKLLDALAAAGADWVQLDEPCLCLDMGQGEKDFFQTLYQKLTRPTPSLRIQVQTFFGDIRDAYEMVCALPVQAVGLDFVEGPHNLRLLEAVGFPEDKILVAGLVNGRNIWRTAYVPTLELLRSIEKNVPSHRIHLAPSSSLLHVPYSLSPENRLAPEELGILAFAREKMEELGELAILSGQAHPETHPLFLRNQARFQDAENINGRCIPAVRQKTKGLQDQNFRRLPEASIRKDCQKKRLQLPPFPTTTIGSFPQTPEIRSARRAFREGRMDPTRYTDFIREKMRECIVLQEKLGLDVLVHGEFERNDMVEYFGEQLEGFRFTHQGWVQSYGTRCVKPPILMGDVRRPQAMTTALWRQAQTFTSKPVKGMLTGPVTLLNWSFVREDLPQEECLLQTALAIREEVLDLETAGCAIIQIDEAALREKLPLRRIHWRDYLERAVQAFRLAHDGVRPDTQVHTHMCYSEFGDILEAIGALDADVLTMEASRSALTLVEQLKEKPYPGDMGPGVYDIHSPNIPAPLEILATLKTLLSVIPEKNLWINPDCGLKTRSPLETEKALEAMITATRLLREEIRTSPEA
ncbi:5-methyltetrahydropteroyltriglutamate--homocysteine S-methyltransferase [Desulfobotulus sp.]|jgi:5-methyltetrahydropteroyltriglutamate--homocysteine methyltransferase|uniref:5-methyltetrahydropteroyltriglutamate-- homocysteine S-methyltransferase n=1 Tax=Desulfobotulus sp. TaxID=1940337 RepID=UPI002A36E044|nr:5-methyltetrahydropteroyltriglutamate--homocysteine S-methyltransferase [Desulfobotulus sp.]MDY0163178.1 5-methyltetrahydropteroyltriglutamate--homocysteine S-methyltransferase [Desulfobotulus sp.]